ncbi:phospholipid-translocating P-type ATPase-like protein [Saccharata proteae CBS 121410]|uniref:Phospholipid-transporting ATPase n=1 Tax=Saccharata proteae CBS 121410 TaxID=1314787 RepID=A0A9P4LYB5_9PEZI|nr:phospholipid-translocating P-type ATPase-like protein [Saccharata proteae CBS 121410]
MSLPHQYHQPDAPASPQDDSDSDLELLDPISSRDHVSSSPPRRSSRNDRRQLHQLGTRIPMRNLRAGRRGTRGRRGDDPEAEDLQGLLEDNEHMKRMSAGSIGTTGDDDAPLLPGPSVQRRPALKKSRMAQIASHFHLPSFLSGSSRQAPPASQPDDEADNDHDPASNRNVAVGQSQTSRFPPNAVSNAKYTPWSFLPRTLYNEFSFFFNLYFLLVALSQIIPALRIGYLSTYIFPLAFVMSITLGKEALDDIARRRRDAEANSEGYTVLSFDDSGIPSGVASKRGLSGTRKNKKGKNKSDSSRLMALDQEEENVENGGSTATIREVVKPSRDLKVGDVLKMGKDQRVPADLVILKAFVSDNAVPHESAEPRTSAEAQPNLIDTGEEASAKSNVQEVAAAQEAVVQQNTASSNDSAGEAFIRTDQLDGETDWKLRLASPLTQSLEVGEFTRLRIVAGKPDKKVNDFVGTVELLPKSSTQYDLPARKGSEASMNEAQSSKEPQTAPLTIDNTAWANTVLASSSTVLAVVVYTGSQTRQALSTSPSRSKTGLLEYEINSLTKILCFLTLAISVILVALKGFKAEDGREWYVSVMRFLILFSTIVPISLRVNLDMGKSVYAWFIQKDEGIPGTVVRTSTIPEDLGRVEYLLSDKTGTLTQNEMEMKKIHVGTVSYANEAMEEVTSYVRQSFSSAAPADSTEAAAMLVTPSSIYVAPATSATRTRREIGSRVRDVVLALALCHNVTPTMEEVDGETVTSYQASSPDEIAIVRWTECVGLRLFQRDRNSMTLQSVETGRVIVRVKILNVFPFTSEGKRMGIVVKFLQGDSDQPSDSEEIWFYQKGADTVMTSIVAANDWLDEETANMAREGLRTLVVGRKKLSPQQYQDFSHQYSQASLSLQGRDAAMAGVVGDFLERDLELLGVTGVEDKLQRDVKPSLELLRNAGIKIWMLTGDKVETARCVAVSSKLVARGQYVHTIAKMKRKELAHDSLDFLRGKPDACLLIDGESLALMLTHYRDDFISVAVRLPTVVACRCSPTQKADVAKLIREYTKKRICCIGDGGNDVSMIQAADVGVGIVGKEGRQASLAADFSIEQFCYLTKLLVWHGRNSYKRSAKLAQFVIHRGLIISVCQTLYSIASDFEPNALYRDWLLVGYATVYTMAPVFSLVLDRDVDESLANLYPELYKELTTGRSLSYRTFFIWVLVSIYQGSIIQGLSQILVGLDDFLKMVSVSFTVLVLNELVMVAAEVTTWHPIMIFSILGTAALFFGSIPFLGGYFDLGYMVTVEFLWKTIVIAAVALVPPYAGKLIGRTLRPPSYRKVQAV